MDARARSLENVSERRPVAGDRMAARDGGTTGEPATLPEGAGRQRSPFPFAFGTYELLAVVAEGGMGVVYKARDTVLDRVVALKMIRSGVLARPEEVERFYREARAVAQLSHPHIVPVYEIGQETERHYFTMVFAGGGTLGQHLNRFADARAAATLLEKVARAVGHAHERGILHRDLKPANVLFDDRGEPLVSDFGLAKFLDAAVELTGADQLLGTPPYMAPEQASGRLEPVTPRSDVWALGVILYEMLTGQRPFRGPSRESILRSIQTADPPHPSGVRPRLDRALEAICLKCLEKDPARRYATGAALADDLGRWLRGEPVQARPQGRLGRFWRGLRRRPSRAVVPALLLAASLALPAARDGAAPAQPEAALRQELAAGRPVTLIGDSGLPRWHRWDLGKGVFCSSSAWPQDDYFSIQSLHESLLTLLPEDPRRKGYWFRAEVRHNNGSDLSCVGLHFGYGKYAAAPGGPEHFHAVLSFADKGRVAALFLGRDGKRRSRAVVRLHFFREPGLTPGLASSPDTRLRQEYDATQGGPWRRLAVRVTPESIRAYWEGHFLGEMKRGELVDEARELLRSIADLDPGAAFGPEGAPGLYLCSGEASFRHVVVEPLK